MYEWFDQVEIVLTSTNAYFIHFHLYARVTTVSRPRNPSGAINKISPGLLQVGIFLRKATYNCNLKEPTYVFENPGHKEQNSTQTYARTVKRLILYKDLCPYFWDPAP